jgi:DNA-binding GntR family transcriptional regulator
VSAVATAAPGTVGQHAVDWLRRAIVAGELRPGERIAQEEVAARIGVSVVPLREALRVLEGEGQVTYRPRRGYVVTELRVEDLAEIYELRRVLEGHTARRVLPGLDAAALARMREAARDCCAAAAAGDVARELEANRRFHFALFEGPGTGHAVRLIRGLWDATEAYRALYYNMPEARAAADEAHKRILNAVRAGEPERVVAELDAHRDHALGTLRGILER